MTTSAAADISADIVILGGGIAGLWILSHLRGLGYSVLLLEASTLGNGQSVCSQGIIHGGLKYALRGSLSEAAIALAGMPSRWRDCLSGNGTVDLQGCRVLSDRYYMWSEGSYVSRLKAFLGSRTLRGKIDLVDNNDYPQPLHEATGQGSLYRLPDFVIDTGSLLRTLGAHYPECIYSYIPSRLELPPEGDHEHCRLRIGTHRGQLELQAKRIVLAAGEGNAALLQLAGLAGPKMQTRPLNMVILRKRSLPPLYLHCVGDSFSLTPRLTLTSHPCANNDMAWYLGGELAETGVTRDDREQITVAGRLVHELFPWVDTEGADWACLRINRAEGREQEGHRPDSVFLKPVKNFLVAWPTKFTLSPALADAVAQELSTQGIVPSLKFNSDIAARFLEPAVVARPPWETCFV